VELCLAIFILEACMQDVDLVENAMSFYSLEIVFHFVIESWILNIKCNLLSDFMCCV